MQTWKQLKAKYAVKRPHQLKRGSRHDRRAAVTRERLTAKASSKLLRILSMQSWKGFKPIDVKYFAKDAFERGMITRRQAKHLGYEKRWA